MSLDFEKFKQAVHYVVWKAGNKPGFGAVKLNKALWFAEARVYMLFGYQMTGATYIREKYGPVPRAMMPAQKSLQDEGVVEVWKDGKQTRFRTKTSPDMSQFKKEEMDALDFWIKEIAEEHTAESISEKSHDYAWEIAKMGEEIPLYALLTTRMRDPKEDELEWARNHVHSFHGYGFRGRGVSARIADPSRPERYLRLSRNPTTRSRFVPKI
jgi:hypothetical protein